MKTSARLAVGCLGLVAGCSTTVEIGGQDRAVTPAVKQNVYQLPEAIVTTSSIDLLSPYVTIFVDEHDDRYIPPPTTTTTTTTTLAPVQAPVAQGDICTVAEAEAFAHSILDPYGIPAPAVEFTPRISNYPFGQNKIELEGCVSRSIVAHEIGHYVQARAFGMVFGAVEQNSLLFSVGTWIRGKEFVPGIEYAAHCIGNILYGNGPYTKCPSAELRQLAREVINAA